jgi:hypothetical protein
MPYDADALSMLYGVPQGVRAFDPIFAAPIRYGAGFPPGAPMSAIPLRSGGLPVASPMPAQRQPSILEMFMNMIVPRAYGADPMSPRDQLNYLNSTGGTIDARPVRNALTPGYAARGPAGYQGVTGGPPANVQGLAALLLRTGRARNPQEALLMAHHMMMGRPR